MPAFDALKRGTCAAGIRIDVTFAQARRDHGLQGIQCTIGYSIADASIGGHFAAQIGLADRRGVLWLVIRGIGQRLAGLRIAPHLRRRHPAREAAKAPENDALAGVGGAFSRVSKASMTRSAAALEMSADMAIAWMVSV